MESVRVALAGVGGYGQHHVRAVERLAAEGLARVAAFADADADARDRCSLGALGARAYDDYAAMLKAEQDLDLVCIATPIPLHLPMAEAALERGLHVFLEKPPVVRIQDLRRLIELEERHERYCAVGFQDVARKNVILFKHRLCDGVLGRVRAVHGHSRWNRTRSYYERSNWSGRLELDGVAVLDGPMNNSCAHMLNLAAYFAGDEPYEFARPEWVQGELYRAAPCIVSEDTDCLRAHMDSGVDLCLHLTQAASCSHKRVWTVIGDKGIAEYRAGEGVRLPGEVLPDDPDEQPVTELLRRLVEVVMGSDEPLLMPLAEAEAFVLLSNGAYESSRRIHPIAQEHVEERGEGADTSWTVRGLDTVMLDAATSGRLLSECNRPWGVATQPFSLNGYAVFPRQWVAD